MASLCVATIILTFLGAADALRKRKDMAASEWQAVLLPGHVDIARPAFLMLDELTKSVVVSQFGRAQKPSPASFSGGPPGGPPGGRPLPLAQSTLSKIPLSDVATWARTGRMDGKVGDTALYVNDSMMLWPNKLDRVPLELGDYLVVPDGFLSPGKANGNIYLANASGSIFRITPAETGSFYRGKVMWYDFNGDGLKDLMTARTVQTGPIWRAQYNGDLLWYENPGLDKLTTEWTQHIITSGPDNVFAKIRYGEGFAIFCIEFWGEKVRVEFVSLQGVKTGSRVIATTIGKAFGIELTDVDGDGLDDLLVTNHQNDDKDDIKSAVYVYEIPSDLENGEFKRHTLAQNISTIKDFNPGVGSPGFAHAFYPKQGMSGFKHVIVAGDGTFDVWYLRPTSTRFKYEHTLIDIGGTTGKMLLNDFDNDGVMDVLVPDNDLWKLHMITFKQ